MRIGGCFYIRRALFLKLTSNIYISPGEKNVTDAAYIASALDEAFIEKMKSDPYKWNRFLQKGSALYEMSKKLRVSGPL